MRPPHVLKTRQPLILNDKEELVLDLLRVVNYATAEDIHHVRFRDKSQAYVRAILAKLSGGQDFAEAAWLYRFPVPSTAKGTKPRAYALGTKAGAVKALDGFYRPSKARHLSYHQMAHDLRLSRFVCSALVMCQTQPQVRLADIRLCYELARELRMAAANDVQPPPVLVVPDAWLHVELLDAETGGHQTYLPIWLEIDNSTMYRLRFQQHVEDRIEFIRSEKYDHFFGAEAVRIAYASIGNRDESRHSRLSAMLTWTQELLAELDLLDWAPVFYFTSLTYEDMYQLAHFLEPRWYTPGDATARYLLQQTLHEQACPKAGRERTHG